MRPVHRRTGRGEAKCARLRAVAAELFLARGYDGVSLDEIVRAAGGSKTNVYGFFGGKEGLFIAAVEAMGQQLQERLRTRDLGQLALEPGLRVLARDLIDLLLEPSHLAFYRLVIGHTARFPGLGAVWYANGPQASRALIAGFLARHADELPPGAAPADIARAFHNMVVMDLLHRGLIGQMPGEAEREGVVEVALRVVFAGRGGS